LDRAEQSIRVAETSGTPPQSMAYFYSRGQLDATRSQCLLQLGDTAQSITAGHAALAGIHHSFVRNRAFSALRVGSAYLASGEIDQAARILGDAARLAAQNGSARLMEEFRATWGQLRPWARTREVRDLDELVIGYGLA
jgi:ATP/maltotriose-dependent transcriptional regulator MalT